VAERPSPHDIQNVMSSRNRITQQKLPSNNKMAQDFNCQIKSNKNRVAAMEILERNTNNERNLISEEYVQEWKHHSPKLETLQFNGEPRR